MKRKTAWTLASALLITSIVIPYIPSRAATRKPKLNIKKLNMTVGSDFCLRVYNLKKKHKVKYVSSNKKIISVTNRVQAGKSATLTALSPGSATVRATVKNGKKVVRLLKCTVKVTPNAFSIKFRKRKIHMMVSDRFHLDPIIKPNTSTEQPIFESDNPSVVSISSLGVATALAPGRATITATLLSTNQTATCTIEVSEPKEDDDDWEMKYNKKHGPEMAAMLLFYVDSFVN